MSNEEMELARRLRSQIRLSEDQSSPHKLHNVTRPETLSWRNEALIMEALLVLLARQ